ncbi:MAG: hypothetical protein RSC76_00945 [Oscillospiraceae bacterium]
MDEMKTIILTACTALIIGEILYFLTPKDKVTDCIYALLYTVAIVTATLLFTKTDDLFSDFNAPSGCQEEIDAEVSRLYLVKTEEALKKEITEALDTVHITVKNVDFLMRVDNENTLHIDELTVSLAYKSDISNTKIILENLFQNEVSMEVTGEK